MQVMRTGVTLKIGSTDGQQKMTCFYDVSLTLHAKCVTMLTSIEQGCGELKNVISYLDDVICNGLGALSHYREANEQMWLIVVINAFDEQVMTSALLPEILEGVMVHLSQLSLELVFEPVYWIWIGHGRPRWMPWKLGQPNMRAPMVSGPAAAYKYPWAS